ncbi:MAG: cytochrome c biogenesis protein CcsA [Rhodocyclaceae bacterium]|nr:cytochrome c biogenesis protein CcsA [Rhodocyclaceae bacterium]
MPILLQLLPAALYAVLAAHFFHSRWLRPDLQAARGLQPWERVALAAVLLLHAWVLREQILPGNDMHFGFGSALAVMCWLALVFYWIESFNARLEGLQSLALPLAAGASALPAFWPAQHIVHNASNVAFRLHFLLAMMAYSLFTLAALHAVLMSIAERRLHSARLTRSLIALPPLLTMETLLFRLIFIAFVLLTLTLGTGILFSEELFGRALPFNHKTVFAFLSWLIFGILLLGRHFRGWRGRIALRWTMGGFIVLLLAYVGTRFVLDLLGRT